MLDTGSGASSFCAGRDERRGRLDGEPGTQEGDGVTAFIVVACSMLLALMILGVELFRGRVRGHIDFLRAASAVYFMCYVVAPVYLQFADLVPIRAGSWRWMLRTPFEDPVFAYGSMLALVGYGFLVSGYWLARPCGPRQEADVRIADSGYLWAAGLSLGAAGLAALVVYAKSIGGWLVFFVAGLAFRRGEPPVVSPWAFLTKVAPIVTGAMLIFFALRQYHKQGPRRLLATALCVGFYGASLAILFHEAGRAALVAFLITLPLATAVQRDRLRFSHVLLGASVFIVTALFGKSFFYIGGDSGAFLNGRVAGVEIGGAARSIVWEFSFPIATLGNVIRSVPSQIGFRWFYDVPLAIAYLVPQRLTGLVHEPTLSLVNTAMFGAKGGIPVDLISFGYFSLAVPGVIAVALGMGALLGLGERVFPPSPDPLRAGLRVSWVLVLAFRVMYADPQLFWAWGLYLVLTSLVLAVPSMLRALLSRMVVQVDPEPRVSG